MSFHGGRRETHGLNKRGMEFRNVAEEGFCSPVGTGFAPTGTVGFKESGSRSRSNEGTPLKEENYPPISRSSPSTKPDTGFRRIVCAFGVLSAVVTIALLVEILTGPPQIAPHGGVSASAQVCFDMGVSILKSGGSAVDAAITTMLCVGVVNFQFAGLGGGGFMVIHDHKSHSSVSIDFRETAPLAATPEKFRTVNNSVEGLFVGIPGELRGIEMAYNKHGKLPWRRLFEPVIHLARDGFNATRSLANCIVRRRRKEDRAKFEKFMDSFSKKFAEGADITEGTLIRRPDLADLLEEIANHGTGVFYQKIAKEIVVHLKPTGGLLSEEDFRTYQAIERKPLVGSFKDFVVETSPAPSSGIILLYLLKLVADFEVDWKSLNSTDYYRQFAQAVEKAKLMQQSLGDPGFSPDVAKLEQQLLNESLSDDGSVRHLADALSVHHSTAFEDKGTSHISVIDDNELMVSVTHSINDYFGSLQLTPSGVLLNNELADFDSSMKNNAIAPGKRPLSSMVPTVAYHRSSPCKQRLAIGGTNGSRIISGVAEVIVDVLGFGWSVSEAVASPRMYCGLDRVCEMQKSELSATVGPELRAANFSLVELPEQPNLVEVVLKHNTTVLAVADQTDGGGGASAY